MPVKWTPDNDQILLLKILETHPNVSLDVSLVSKAWPADREKPTPRAITERLVKIRKSAGVHFSVGSAGSNGTPKKPRTPSKKKSIPGNPPTPTSSNASGSGKRKRVVPKQEPGDVDDDEMGDVKVPPSQMSGSNPSDGNEVHYIDSDAEGEADEEEDDDAPEFTTPSKKAKVAANSTNGTNGDRGTSFRSSQFPISYEGDDTNGYANGVIDGGFAAYEELDLSGPCGDAFGPGDDFGYGGEEVTV